MTNTTWGVCAAVAAFSIALVCGCDEGMDGHRAAAPPAPASAPASTSAAQSPAPASAPASTSAAQSPTNSKSPAAAADTARLATIAKRFGAALAVRAETTAALAKGEVLSESDSKAHLKSEQDVILICAEICQLLDENPHWTEQMTVALTRNAKAAYITDDTAGRALERTKPSAQGRLSIPYPRDNRSRDEIRAWVKNWHRVKQMITSEK